MSWSCEHPARFLVRIGTTCIGERTADVCRCHAPDCDKLVMLGMDPVVQHRRAGLDPFAEFRHSETS